MKEKEKEEQTEKGEKLRVHLDELQNHDIS